MRREDVEALMSYLRGEKEDEAADLVGALLDRAERAEAELADLIHDIERAKEQHMHLLAERDAAFAAGQEEMRRRAVAATASVETDHPAWVNTGSWACAAELCGIRINDLPIKDKPDDRQ